jgi:signal transduction histidine kinase
MIVSLRYFVVIIFWLLLLSCNRGVAQDKLLQDSIKIALDTLPTLETKMDYLKSVSRKNIRKNEDYAFEINNLAISIAKASKDNKQLARMIAETGILYSIKAKYKESKPHFIESIRIYKSINDSLGLGYQYRNLGLAYVYQEKKDSALISFYESLSHLDRNNEKHLLFYGLTCLDITNIMSYLGHSKASTDYINVAIAIFEQINDTFNMAAAYNSKNLHFINRPELIDSMIMRKAINLTRAIKDTFNLAIHLYNYSNYLYNIGENEKANDTLDFAFYLYQKDPRKNLNANFQYAFGNRYFMEGKYKEAEKNYFQALEEVKNQANIFNLQADIYAALKRLYQTTGRYKEALVYADLELESSLSDLALKNMNLIDIYEKDLQYREQKKQTDILALNNTIFQKDLQYKNQINSTLVVGIIILLSALFALLFFNSKLKKQKVDLLQSKQNIELQKEELRLINENKEQLISIIGHDFRGPLNNLAQILDLIPDSEDSLTKDSDHILKLSKTSITGMQDLLMNLLVWAKSQKAPLSSDNQSFNLSQVLQHTLELYNTGIKLKNLDIQLDLDKEIIVNLDSGAFEVIFRNLLNNSIKLSDNGSLIKIQSLSYNGTILLSIEDECGGMPEQLINSLFHDENNDIQNLSIKNGLGLVLTKQLMLLIGASWKYESTSKGCIITLSIPKLTKSVN